LPNGICPINGFIPSLTNLSALFTMGDISLGLSVRKDKSCGLSVRKSNVSVFGLSVKKLKSTLATIQSTRISVLHLLY